MWILTHQPHFIVQQNPMLWSNNQIMELIPQQSDTSAKLSNTWVLETSHLELLWSISTYLRQPSYEREHAFANRTRKDKHIVNALKNIFEYFERSTVMPDQQLDKSAQYIWQCDLELQLVNKSYTHWHMQWQISPKHELHTDLVDLDTMQADRNHIYTVFALWSWKKEKERGSGQLDPQ